MASNSTTYVPLNDELVQMADLRANEAVNKMQGAINNVLERGENLEDLKTKAESLEFAAHDFSKTATNVKNKMWWKNIKMMLLLSGLIAIIVIGIILGIVFGTRSPVTVTTGGNTTSTNTP
ncbi:hypothetical protein HDV05_003689 [Chytridiales sp. JEL 0842]|nr:hypothetical protein HDV05_003689 [Chytridiales sp. JEL 0842]